MVIVRASDRTYETLKQLSEQTGRSMRELVDEAVERYRREAIIARANAAYAALRADPAAWQEELRERAEWDSTLLDGLEQD